MTDFGDIPSSSTMKAGDQELQEFLMVEKQKAQFNAQVRLFHLEDFGDVYTLSLLPKLKLS